MLTEREVRRIAGFDVVIVPTQAATVTVRAVVNAGGVHEAPGPRGAAHFLEHLFFKGSTRRGYEQINREIARIGDTNAYTDYDRTVFYINTLGETAAQALSILCELLFEPAMDPAEFDRERGVILEEWRAGRDDPWNAFYQDATGLVMPAPFDVPVIGTEQSIEGMTLADLHAFRDRNYTRSNIAFVLAGDLSRLDLDTLERTLGAVRVEDGAENHVPQVVVRRARPGIFERLTHPAEQAIVSLWAPTFTDEQDRAQACAMSVLYNALGGGQHSLLYDRVREKLGLAYSVGAFEWHYRETATGIISAATSRENAPRCIDAMQEVIAELGEFLMDEDLEQVARANCLFGLAGLEDSLAGLSHVYFDRHFASRHEMDTSMQGFRQMREIFHGPGKERVREVARDYARTVLSEPTIVVQNC